MTTVRNTYTSNNANTTNQIICQHDTKHTHKTSPKKQDVDQLIRSTAWRSAGAIEGLRVLEEERGSKQRARAAALCRKMQASGVGGHGCCCWRWGDVWLGSVLCIPPRRRSDYIPMILTFFSPKIQTKQTVLPAAPIKVFLAFMATEGSYPAPAPAPAAAAAGTGTDEVNFRFRFV